MATTSAAADQPRRRGFLPLVCPTQPIIFVLKFDLKTFLFKQYTFCFDLTAELVMILAVVVLFLCVCVCVCV